MSFLDKVIGAVTPPESEETRLKARDRARVERPPGHWLTTIIDHHEQLEQAFAEVKQAGDAASRRQAQQRLWLMFLDHSNAEEAMLYPELAQNHKTEASMAYEEQQMTKVQFALLDKIDPMSQDYLDKFEHIRGAVTHHMYQEESDWFLELASELPERDQEEMARRYRDEIARCTGSGLA
ncbi:MAG: hypothetical protein JWL91_2072 [Sphingomonas bacterium]|nr:hemerythrin domain-containing protein [Sphingomonas bacterium]MDB5690196.1 hypothetical protein [Sphingomonas bacterium]